MKKLYLLIGLFILLWSPALGAQTAAYHIPEDDPSQTIGPEAVATESDLRVRLRGASIGIGGSFRF
ncbi:MAG: hypothetical protein ACOCVC_03050 [Spirochaeta sp.]